MPSAFKSLSGDVKPRERILAAGSARGLATHELIAVLLKTGTAGCDVLELSRRLVSAFGSMRDMIRSDAAEFRHVIACWNKSHSDLRISGLGAAKMAELLAAFEFARRGMGVPLQPLVSLDDAAELFFSELGEGENQECVFVLLLDSQNRPLRRPERVTKGLLNSAPIDVREVFSRALRCGAASVIVAHNHPSGSIEPSDEDVRMTRRLKDAGRLVGVDLHDHLILGHRPNFTSLNEIFASA